MEEEIIGRESEISRLTDLLHEGKHVLIVISSKRGMGRSTLLNEFRTRAKKMNWDILPPKTDKDPFINPNTDEHDFHEKVPIHQPPATMAPDTLTSSSLSQGSFNRHPGCLVLIDGYQPSQGFEKWFLRKWIPKMSRESSPVVIVVAGYPSAVKTLSESAKSATVMIELGPLPLKATMEYFSNLNEHLELKMQVEELHAYASASSDNPSLIGAFTRLFRLTGWRAMRKQPCPA